MTAIEHRELKGITIKNLVVTVLSTASIVASVMTTYFGLKNDIRDIKSNQDTETRVNNLRLKVLEGQIAVLQKEIDEIKPTHTVSLSQKGLSPVKVNEPVLLSSVENR